MTLHELQSLCVTAFTDADGFAACDELADQIEAGIIPSPTRISVYRSNFRENVYGTLQKVFPVVEQLVGEQCFRLLTY